MDTIVTPAALRGLGRSAYRAGTIASGSIAHARSILGRDLTAGERMLVMAGWAAERMEVCS